MTEATQQNEAAAPTLESVFDDHAKLVAALAKPGADIVAQLTPEKAHLWHMASCVGSEAGELFDAVKKHVIYDQPAPNMENIIEELGDLEFYMEGIRSKLGITRERTLIANMAKLNKRFSAGKYSNEAAQQRADKVETEQKDLPHSLDNKAPE